MLFPPAIYNMVDHKKVINFKSFFGSYLSAKGVTPQNLKFPACLSTGYRLPPLHPVIKISEWGPWDVCTKQYKDVDDFQNKTAHSNEL